MPLSPVSRARIETLPAILMSLVVRRHIALAKCTPRSLDRCSCHKTYHAESTAYDWKAIIDDLNALLRLRTTPIGMKMFATVEEMEAIPKIRRPKSIHTTDQIVAQAARLGWTVGITMKDLVGAQCGAVIGLHPRDEDWLSGKAMAGVWYSTLEGFLGPSACDGYRAAWPLPRDGGVAARRRDASILPTYASSMAPRVR